MFMQSPAIHKINSQANRTGSLLESYPGTTVQIQCEGRGDEGQREGENKTCQT